MSEKMVMVLRPTDGKHYQLTEDEAKRQVENKLIEWDGENYVDNSPSWNMT